MSEKDWRNHVADMIEYAHHEGELVQLEADLRALLDDPGA